MANNRFAAIASRQMFEDCGWMFATTQSAELLFSAKHYSQALELGIEGIAGVLGRDGIPDPDYCESLVFLAREVQARVSELRARSARNELDDFPHI